MTKQEFEERTGLRTDAEEYAKIEKMYMAAGEMDKDEFCRCWRQTGKNPLTRVLARQAEILRGKLEERNNELEDAQEKKMELAKFLLGKAQAYNHDTDFRREAVRLIGEWGVVRLKLLEGYELWDEEREFLLAVMQGEIG